MINSQLTIYKLQGALLAALVALPAAAWSQTPQDGTVAFDPIRCWWRTSAPAVRTGESFSVFLTCALLDTPEARAVVDEQKLNVSVIQFAPFEVAGGSRAADLVTPGRRFFQYEYMLRAISPDLIGQDVALPLLEVAYRIESRLPDNSAQVGRDLTYLLPVQKMRVVSMVPNDADDIRDSTTERFGRVESLRSRAGLLRIVGFGSLALGGLMAVLTLVGIVTRARKGVSWKTRQLSDRGVVNAAVRELGNVRKEAEGSWTEDLVSRAAAAARIVGAAAIGRSSAQQVAGADVETAEGRLLVPLRGRRAAISSAVTTTDLDRGLAGLKPAASAARRSSIEALRSALATFTSAQYGPAFAADRTALDQAVERTIEAASQVKPPRQTPLAWLRQWSGEPATEAHR